MAIKTGKVTGRRKLMFSNYNDILDEARRLSSAPTRQLGNWSLGQICDHLARGIEMAVEGPPFRPPALLRVIAPFLKRRFLTQPMGAGFTLPKNAASLLPGEISDADGLAKLETSIHRLQATPQRARHGFFGVLSDDEWDMLNCRHAEMHLSFIEPEHASGS